MARKSTASLSVVPLGAKAKAVAPDYLTDAETAFFNDVVSTKPADWFEADNLPLLVEYVRAKCLVDALDLMVKAALAGGEMGDLDKAVRLRDLERKSVASLATKLRLTPQSRWQPKSADAQNRKAGSARPWES